MRQFVGVEQTRPLITCAYERKTRVGCYLSSSITFAVAHVCAMVSHVTHELPLRIQHVHIDLTLACAILCVIVHVSLVPK